jgi:peptide/nickel transport system substrate-binding protein
MWPFRGAALLALSGLLLSAGCDNNPQQKPWRETREDGTPWRVYYWVQVGDVRSLDPQKSYDQVSNRVLEPIHDCLLEYEVMKTRPYTLGPCLLEEVPKPQPGADGSVTYHCALKPGILFHDDPCFRHGKGREVVAQDVQYAFQRLCDPHVESPFFSNLAENLITTGRKSAASKSSMRIISI